MTTESQKAFEARKVKGLRGFSAASYELGWLDSRQHIIDKLNSPEMVERAALAIIIARDGKKDGKRRFQDKIVKQAYIALAQAAIAAVLEGI